MHIVIAGQPVSKKNSQQIVMNPKTKRPFVMPSKAYKVYEKEALKQIEEQFSSIDRYYLPFDGPCEVVCKFYMGTRRKVDLTNLLESADDILVRGGVLEDDNCNVIVSHDGSRVYYDKDNPRTEIDIIELVL